MSRNPSDKRSRSNHNAPGSAPPSLKPHSKPGKAQPRADSLLDFPPMDRGPPLQQPPDPMLSTDWKNHPAFDQIAHYDAVQYAREQAEASMMAGSAAPQPVGLRGHHLQAAAGSNTAPAARESSAEAGLLVQRGSSQGQLDQPPGLPSSGDLMNFFRSCNREGGMQTPEVSRRRHHMWHHAMAVWHAYPDLI